MTKFSRADAILLAACIAGPAIVIGMSTVFTLWVLPWTSEFGVSRASVMLIFAFTSLLSTCLMPFAGRLLVTVPAWKFMATGAIVMGLGFLLLYFATSFWAMGLIYAVATAAGTLLCGPLTAQSLAYRRFPGHIGAIGGLMSLGVAIGMAGLPLILAPLLATLGWRMTLPIAGLVILTVVPGLAWLFLRNAAAPPAPTAGDPEPQTKAPAALAVTARQAIGAWAFWSVLAGILPIIAIQQGVKANVAPYLADIGVTVTQSGYMLSAMSGASALGAVAVGYFADRLDPRWVLAGVCIIMGSGLGLLAIQSQPGLAGVALVAMGFAAGGVLPLLAVFIVGRFGTASYAPVAGLMSLFMIPAAFGPAAAGAIRDLTGSYQAVFIGAIQLLVVGVLLAWRSRKTPLVLAKT